MTVVDSFLLRCRAAVGRLGAALRQMTSPERVLAGALGLWIVGTVAALFFTASTPTWMVALDAVAVAFLACPVLADALVARDSIHRVNAALMRTNSAKPTGAPRVAEVPCKHGDMHRFVYGPTGWAPAGPAPDHRPEPEEARA